MAESIFPGAASANSPRPSAAAQLLAAYAGGERTFPRLYLAGADLHAANLQDTNFYAADFTGADLSGADLSRANLAYAKLASANLRGANLSDAYLEHADLTGADTTGIVTDRPTPPLSEPAKQPEDKSPLLSVENHFGVENTLSIEGKLCVNCHAALPAEAAFCPKCGTAVEAPRSPWLAGATPRSSEEHVKPAVPQASVGLVPQTGHIGNLSTSTVGGSGVRKSTGKSTLDASDVLLLILSLLGSGWNLVVRLAVVIVVIVGGVAFINSCAASATLSEHSSCQQFQEASADAQTKVLQDMMAAHHDQESLSTARFSVTLYCNLEGGSAPIDGVYSGGDTGQQPAQALHIWAPLAVLATSSQE